MRARDLMRDDMAVATVDADPVDVAKQLAATPTGVVVIVDDERCPIGIVTRSDLARARVEAGTPPPPWLIRRKSQPLRLGNAPPLREIMTSPPIYVPEIARLLELAQLIETRRLKRIPVVGDGGLVGLLCRNDVLRALGRDLPERTRTNDAFTAQAFRELVARYEEREKAALNDAQQQAQEARKRLIDDLATRELTDRAWAEMLAAARRAAEVGEKEFEIIRFPAELCSDGGRAINAPDPSWPRTLQGEPRGVFERWRRELQPAGFRLAAQIATFPEGFLGDAALILIWGR